MACYRLAGQNGVDSLLNWKEARMEWNWVVKGKGLLAEERGKDKNIWKKRIRQKRETGEEKADRLGLKKEPL